MNTNMIFKQLLDYETNTYTYIIADEKTKDAVVIDPVFENATRDEKLITELWLRVKYFLDTHLQFLTEALSISVIWGAIGIFISYAAVFLLNYFSIAAVISVDSIILSFCFSLLIWLVFGILPAYQAAKLRPIDALRFE